MWLPFVQPCHALHSGCISENQPRLALNKAGDNASMFVTDSALAFCLHYFFVLFGAGKTGRVVWYTFKRKFVVVC